MMTRVPSAIISAEGLSRRGIIGSCDVASEILQVMPALGASDIVKTDGCVAERAVWQPLHPWAMSFRHGGVGSGRLLRLEGPVVVGVLCLPPVQGRMRVNRDRHISDGRSPPSSQHEKRQRGSGDDRDDDDECDRKSPHPSKPAD
jgi:hypothetical protein